VSPPKPLDGGAQSSTRIRFASAESGRNVCTSAAKSAASRFGSPTCRRPARPAPLAEPVHDTANLLHRRAAARRQLRDGAGPERDRTDDRDLVGVHPLERRGERVDGAQPLGQLGEAAWGRLHQCVRAVLQQRRQRARIQTGQVARETLLAHQMCTRCPAG
jgi:hypothetical protein